jgi:methyl-accepting chemotaxis protein
MVEQSTAASHSLAKEAKALFQLIGRFEIGNTRNMSASSETPSIADVTMSPARKLMNRVATAVRGSAA